MDTEITKKPETITLELTQAQANHLYIVLRADKNDAEECLPNACTEDEHDNLVYDITLDKQIMDKFPRPVPSTEIFDDVPF